MNAITYFSHSTVQLRNRLDLTMTINWKSNLQASNAGDNFLLSDGHLRQTQMFIEIILVSFNVLMSPQSLLPTA